MARPPPLPSFLATKGIAESLLASVMVIIVAFAEETVFRGYLSLRFKAVTESPNAAILLSAVIFSLGHGYEGSAGVITVGVMGLLFDLVYVWRQSLVAPMVVHFLQDFVSIVLLPIVGMKRWNRLSRKIPKFASCSAALWAQLGGTKKRVVQSGDRCHRTGPQAPGRRGLCQGVAQKPDYREYQLRLSAGHR